MKKTFRDMIKKIKGIIKFLFSTSRPSKVFWEVYKKDREKINEWGIRKD